MGRMLTIYRASLLLLVFIIAITLLEHESTGMKVIAGFVYLAGSAANTWPKSKN